MNQLRYVSIHFQDPPSEHELTLSQINKNTSTSNTVYRGRGRHYQHYLYAYFPKPVSSCIVIGTDASPGNFQIQERDIDDRFMIFVIRGRGTLNGREFRAGQFFTLSPHYVSTLISDPQDPWVLCWFSWRGIFPSRFSDIYERYQSGIFYSFQNPEALLQLFNGFLYCDHSYCDARMLIDAFSGCVLSMFVDMQPIPAEEAAASAPSQRIRAYVEKAKEILTTQYATININDLSQQLHLDRKYLCRIFHMITGTTPQNYLIDIRLQNSTMLLTETERSLEEIALECGYSSYNCFLQAFKKRYCITPPEYRRNVRM